MGGYIGATAVGLTTTAADVQGDITSTDTTPELILKNTSEEDTEGGREGKITFKGEQSGGEETTLAQIESAHDGTSDDQKGDLIFKTNDGSDGASPTEAMRIDSDGNVGIGDTDPDNVLNVKESALSGRGASNGNTSMTLEHATDTGIQFFSATQTQIRFGDAASTGAGSIIYAHGDDSLRISANGSERMRIDSSGNVGIGTSSMGYPAFADNLTIADSANAGLTIRSGTSNDGSIYFSDATGSGTSTYVGYIAYNHSENSLRFATGSSERMRIVDGTLLVGHTSKATFTTQTELFQVGGGGTAFVIERNDSIDVLQVNTLANTTNNRTHYAFRNSNGYVGTINTSGSSTTYSTSSDYRLKENITDVTDGITRVKQLSPKRFNFIADADTTVDGFLAHEAATVVPEAVSGDKDAVDSDGNIKPQGIDQSKLVPLLTAALQEAIAKIETLETQNTTQATQIADLITRVETLEGA